MEVGGYGCLFDQAVQDRNEGGNRVQRSVKISQGVEDGGWGLDMEGEGEGSIKQFNGGTGIDKT